MTQQKGKIMYVITITTQGKKYYYSGTVIQGIPNFTPKKDKAIKYATKKEANYYNKFAKGTLEEETNNERH